MDYTDEVIKHFLNPHNVGEIADADGVGEVGNPKCGDIMKVFLKVKNNIIIDAKFKTFGCAAAIATSSVATDLIIGKTLEDALKVTNKDVMDVLGGLPSIKVHCSLLAEQAITEAISDYYRRNEIDPSPIIASIKHM